MLECPNIRQMENHIKSSFHCFAWNTSSGVINRKSNQSHWDCLKVLNGAHSRRGSSARELNCSLLRQCPLEGPHRATSLLFRVRTEMAKTMCDWKVNKIYFLFSFAAYLEDKTLHSLTEFLIFTNKSKPYGRKLVIKCLFFWLNSFHT